MIFDKIDFMIFNKIEEYDNLKTKINKKEYKK